MFSLVQHIFIELLQGVWHCFRWDMNKSKKIPVFQELEKNNGMKEIFSRDAGKCVCGGE